MTPVLYVFPVAIGLPPIAEVNQEMVPLDGVALRSKAPGPQLLAPALAVIVGPGVTVATTAVRAEEHPFDTAST